MCIPLVIECSHQRYGDSSEKKKAAVAEHPEALSHVGLLINEPLGQAELLFI